MRIIRVSARVPKRWEDALEEFLLQRQADGLAPRTIQDYRAWVGRFFHAFPDAWRDYETLRRAVLRHFAGLGDKAPATFNLSLKYLRSFFGWCVREGYIPADPTGGITRKKDEGRARSTPAEILNQLLALPNRNTYAGTRDLALILLQIDTGIRPGEALRLLPGHFNLKALEVAVPREIAKNRSSRTVVYSPQVARAVRRLLVEIRPPDWDDSVPVFASQDGRPMLEYSWGHRLARYGLGVTPYDLRHTAAIMFLRGGGNVFALQRMLDHADLQMTKRYLALTEQDLHREHSTASPVNQLLPGKSRVRKVR